MNWSRIALSGALLTFAVGIAWAGPQGRISLSQASFVSPDYSLTERKDFQLISAGIDTFRGNPVESEIENNLQAQIRGMMAPGAQVLNYLDISQLFWKQQIFSVGRKKIKWSQIDETFGLGVYQPLFKWNSLQSESQGLTGLFMHVEETRGTVPWGLTLFGSPLYIPNQGAGYEIKDGKFENTNPYFNAPPQNAIVNGQKAQFQYVLQKPEMSEVIYQQSFAGQVFLGDRKRGFHAQGAFAQKPMNELTLGFKGVLIPDQKIETPILPQVMSHNLMSAEARYSFSHVSVGIAGISETPQDPKFDSQWTYAKYSPASLVSPFVDIYFRGAELNFALLSVQGGETSFAGPQAKEAETVLIPHFPFRNAAVAQVKYQYRVKRNENIGFSTRYLRGEKGEFDLWTGTVAYQWQERWAAQLTSQMVAIQPVSFDDKTLYHSYAENDLVAVGVSYVF
ncbi:MAG: hypothetical protein ACXWC9_08120 [Pseudobdellovibrionaceae bacterium]